MYSIRLQDPPKFALGTAIKGVLNINQPQLQRETVKLKKLVLGHYCMTTLLFDQGNKNLVKSWQDVKLVDSVEIQINGRAVIPFEIPLAPHINYSSEGQTGNIKVTFINIVRVMAFNEDSSPRNPETTFEVILTPRVDAVPIREVHTHQFQKFCCVSDGKVVLEVEIPNTLLDRAKRVFPIKARIGANTSGRKIKCVSARVLYGISGMYSSTDIIRLLNRASTEESARVDTGEEVTLPLVLTSGTGWQSLKCYPGPTSIMALIEVTLRFEDNEETIVRTFDVSIL